MRARATRVRGAALILAMLIAALAATVAISLAASQQQWFAGVALRNDQVQAQALAQSGVQWARQILFDQRRTSQIDYLGQPWALPLPPTPIEDGSIQGRIVDAQGLLNVNSLGLPGARGGGRRGQQEAQHAHRRLVYSIVCQTTCGHPPMRLSSARACAAAGPCRATTVTRK